MRVVVIVLLAPVIDRDLGVFGGLEPVCIRTYQRITPLNCSLHPFCHALPCGASHGDVPSGVIPDRCGWAGTASNSVHGVMMTNKGISSYDHFETVAWRQRSERGFLEDLKKALGGADSEQRIG